MIKAEGRGLFKAIVQEFFVMMSFIENVKVYAITSQRCAANPEPETLKIGLSESVQPTMH